MNVKDLDVKAVKLFGNRVVLEQLNDDKQNEMTTPGGIVLTRPTEDMKDNVEICRVIGHGPGCVDQNNVAWKPNVKVGDLVVIPKGNMPIILNGKRYIICEFAHILGAV